MLFLTALLEVLLVFIKVQILDKKHPTIKKIFLDI